MLNEFRQDPVSGDWVLYATHRARKPGAFEKDKFYQTKEECPFDGQRLIDQGRPLAVWEHGKKVEGVPDNWTTLVINNKFPAVESGMCSPIHTRGPISTADGRGFHELVITRDHDRHFAQFTDEETAEVIMAYKDRYNAMATDNCGDYISIFHNHGHLAGATVYHNHTQILSMPIIPSGVLRNVKNSVEYFERTGERIHEVVLAWEMQERKRIIYENEKFVVLCPYVSRAPYQVRIFPKIRNAYFGDLDDADIPFLAQALNMALKKINKALDNIDYAFFIHTSPPHRLNVPSFDFYHWHVEILPRSSIAAGLELGTNVFVNVVDPDVAAAELREAVI